jgi:VIT1/CCC1 family predicted Fe2+/Mn2+ transporter
MTDTPPLTPEQRQFLAELAQSASDELESSSSAVTNRAFNQGCVVGLLPAGLFVLLTYVLTHGSFTGTAMSCVLMAMALVIFANLAANIARVNTNRRAYQVHIQAEIEQALAEHGLSRDQFDAVALESLAPIAALRDFIKAPVSKNQTIVGRLIGRIRSL